MNWDNTQALSEGWDLFQVDYRIQLQRIDDPLNNDLGYAEPKFTSDTEAIIFVALQAHAGSTYHKDALDRVGELIEELK